MSEASIEKYFIRMCKEMNMKAIKMVPTYEIGIPDRQVLFQGVSGFAEIKKQGKTPRANQVVYMENLRKAGFFTGVVDSKESAIKWLEDFKLHALNLTTKASFCPVCAKQMIKPGKEC